MTLNELVVVEWSVEEDGRRKSSRSGRGSSIYTQEKRALSLARAHRPRLPRDNLLNESGADDTGRSYNCALKGEGAVRT